MISNYFVPLHLKYKCFGWYFCTVKYNGLLAAVFWRWKVIHSKWSKIMFYSLIQISANCLKWFLSGFKTNLASFKPIWWGRIYFRAYFDIFIEKLIFFANLHFWLDLYSKLCTTFSKGVTQRYYGISWSQKIFKLKITRYHINKTINRVSNKHVCALRSRIACLGETWEILE